MPVHDVAARGFGDSAESYEAARPSYPRAAVEWLVTELGIGAGARVCDLAAGTGKLTRQLTDLDATLVAVEPVRGMRTVLARELPTVRTVAAVAEAMPTRGEALDAVVVAQAFHWFDADAVLAEIARVLRPGGHLGLIWNAWDGSVPWLAAVHRVVGDADATPHWVRGHLSREWVLDEIDAAEGFGPVRRAQFSHHQPLTHEGVVERVATTSHIASASDASRARTLAEVRRILATDPATRDRDLIEFAYVVDCFACERR